MNDHDEHDGYTGYEPDQWYEGADYDTWGPEYVSHFDTREEEAGDR